MKVTNSPDSTKPLFAPYESAFDEFLRAGGHTALVICSPRALLRQYRLEFGDALYAHGARVEEAIQDHVSVRGTTIAGHDFEWPEPE